MRSHRTRRAAPARAAGKHRLKASLESVAWTRPPPTRSVRWLRASLSPPRFGQRKLHRSPLYIDREQRGRPDRERGRGGERQGQQGIEAEPARPGGEGKPPRPAWQGWIPAISAGTGPYGTSVEGAAPARNPAPVRNPGQIPASTGPKTGNQASGRHESGGRTRKRRPGRLESPL